MEDDKDNVPSPPQAGSLVGNELIEKLFPLHRPINGTVEAVLDDIRYEFTRVAHYIVDHTVLGPNQTIALRKLHEAQMAAIFAVVANQEIYRDVR